jgi:hypothetical protein
LYEVFNIDIEEVGDTVERGEVGLNLVLTPLGDGGWILA